MILVMHNKPVYLFKVVRISCKYYLISHAILGKEIGRDYIFHKCNHLNSGWRWFSTCWVWNPKVEEG